MVHKRAEFLDSLLRHGHNLQTSEQSCCVFIMFKKIETPAACEMRSVIRFLNAKNVKPAEILNFVTCMENMPWVVQWYGDGGDCLMKDAKMCMMIRGADRHAHDWMKIWCVQLKRRSERTDNTPLRHFPCIFLKFHGHFFTKLCLMDLGKYWRALWYSVLLR